MPNAKPTEGWGLDGMKEEEAAVPRDAPAGAEGGLDAQFPGLSPPCATNGSAKVAAAGDADDGASSGGVGSGSSAAGLRGQRRA